MLDLDAEISDYCVSENFLLLESSVKPHAEIVLRQWAENSDENVTVATMDESLKKIARLELPVMVRKESPHLLKGFFDFIVATGRMPQAASWPGYVEMVENRYLESLRDDGSVRGETFRKRSADIGRNDPCPCGSGLKFKKCCLPLIADG